MEKKRINNLFLGVTVLGTLFVLTETVLHAMGRSICGTAGCAMVASSARFGDASILLIGLALFFVLTALSFAAFLRGRSGAYRLIDPVLIAALAGEGFFTGYQAFRLFTPCLFCLTVFAFLLALGLLRLLAGSREVIAGFVSLAAVFSLFYLVLPAPAFLPVPSEQKLVLFYSKECKYCSELINELDQKKVPVVHVLVAQYSGMLKSMGIDHVPTLYVNNGQEKIFLTGKERIEQYLSACTSSGRPVPPGSRQPAKTRGAPAADLQHAQGSLDPFGNQGSGLHAVLPSSEEGVCRETEVCK